MRSEIGDRVYRVENAVLRDTARLLAPIRDGAVSPTPSLICGNVTQAVSARKVPAWSSGSSIASDVGPGRWRTTGCWQVSRNLDRGQDPVRGVAGTDDDPAAVPTASEPIRNSFDAIGDGIARTYSAADGESWRQLGPNRRPSVHQWRKRAKYLRHQLEILRPLWPELLEGDRFGPPSPRRGSRVGNTTWRSW
ncbi:MAG: hypothetical protein KatS3mg011_1447 [Acidimicrobiia bacterium]|nr:MAG: hypothetical protein KatS3mg011_1447 [Acidimicrobiia bacterium]